MAALRAAITLLIALVVLTACGGDDPQIEEDRRFATDPGNPTTEATVESPTSTAVTSPESNSATTAATPAISITPEASPVVVQSVIATVYAISHGAVIAIDVETGSTRVICRSRGDDKIARISPSPDGASVAIVWTRGEGETPTYDLEIRSRMGEVTAFWSDIEASLDMVQEPGNGRLVIDWSRQGGKIAIAFPNGGAIVVPVTGDPAVLLTRGQAPGPLAMEWSSNGDAIAFTSRKAGSESAYLAIATVQALPVDPVRIAGTGGDRPIYDLAWLPDGKTLLAIQGSAGMADRVGGDLIKVDRRTLTPQFAIGASRFGPSAEIVTVESSPDGQLWAVVTVSPDAGGGLTASVWLITADLSSQIRISLPEDPPVGDVTWTTQGLSVTLIEPDQVQVLTVDRNGQDVSVVAAPEASPEASPHASPEAVAPAEATPSVPPIASPESVPAASPEATPVPDDAATPASD